MEKVVKIFSFVSFVYRFVMRTRGRKRIRTKVLQKQIRRYLPPPPLTISWDRKGRQSHTIILDSSSKLLQWTRAKIFCYIIHEVIPVYVHNRYLHDWIGSTNVERKHNQTSRKSALSCFTVTSPNQWLLHDPSTFFFLDSVLVSASYVFHWLNKSYFLTTKQIFISDLM